LTFAAEQGYAGIVRILLDHGANPQITRSDGLAAAAIAMENGQDDIATLIEGIRHSKGTPDRKVQ
jgi:ankyrin repeat protein